MNTIPRSRRRGSPARLTKLWNFLVIAMMLASIMPALANPVSAQGDTGEATDTIEQPADVTEQETDTTEPPADTTSVEQTTDTTGESETTTDTSGESNTNQSLQDQDTDNQTVETPATGSVTVNYRLCPADTDPATADGPTLASACTVAGEGASFNLTGTAGDLGTQATGPVQSSVTFPNIVADSVTLTQLMPPPGNIGVFCEGNTSYGNTKPYARAFAAGAASVALDVLDGETIACDWYAMAPATTGGSLTLYKWQCDPGTEYGQTDPNYYPTQCATEQPGINFTLTDNTGTTPFQSDTNGKQLDNIVPDAQGKFTLTETIPQGYGDPVVMCQTLDDPAPTLMTSTGGVVVITPTVASGFAYQCFWYNLPSTPGTVTIYKWQCDPETLYGQTDPDYYSTQCATEQPGIDFTLTDKNGTQSFKSDTNGKQINGVVPDAQGKVTFKEVIPSGYGDPVVYCQTLDDSTSTLMPSTGGTVVLTPATSSGFDYQCFWYNVPTHGFSVTVYKWKCDPGTLYSQTDPNYYPTQCATEQPGVDFTLTDKNGTQPFKSDTNGKQIDGVVADINGKFTLTETMPSGYGDPVGFCQTLNGQPGVPATLLNGVLTVQVPPNLDDDYQCWFYNVPETAGTVTIYKWECPQGTTIDPTFDAHKTACTQPMNNVKFTLQDSAGPRPMTTAGGMVQWTDVKIETFTVTEEVPAGYSVRPYVSCDFDSQNNVPISSLVTNNVLTATLNHSGQKIICHWFNQYMGPGDVTIYKWTCPEGYDINAWGANPKTDCTDATNGINFVLDQPVGVDLQTMTGDSIPGAVYFGGLTPGDYTVSEAVPSGISQVFVLDCVGLNTSSVHPVPLSIGSTLAMKIAGGDKIRCDWYNVPQPSPEYGWMTVTKYNCTTPTYVSDIDCQVFEGGKTFDLQMWNGTAWTISATGTTNTAGQLIWANLTPGTYRVVEQGETACKVTSNPVDTNGNPMVQVQTQTSVKVYNCGKTPPAGGKMPTKYPNTGVDPAVSIRVAPAATILGLLGLAGATSITRRTFLRRSLVATAAMGPASLVVANGFANQVIQPIGTAVTGSEGTAEASPGVECLYPATPSAATPSSGTPVACARGAVPEHIAIEAIGVDANMEVLEIIDGEMQAPSGATDVAWYKESARLGEQGNILLAGHLNYWGVPEGVFFALAQLKQGDAVEIQGDDGEAYRYIVQWAQDFPSDENPPEEALGQTKEQAITMITCGGEWITDRAEYDHRTLVRAIRESEYVPSTPVATPGA